MSQVKIRRAAQRSSIGRHPASFDGMLAAIPEAVRAALPSHLLAQLVDANWQLASASKASAARDACDEGAVWDARHGRMRALAA